MVFALVKILKTATILIALVSGFTFGWIVASQVIKEGKDTNENILEEYIATDGQFPYQVEIRKKNKHSCGGSIISNLWILTAGHCIDRVPLQDLVVLVGITDLLIGGLRYRVVQSISHEWFQPLPLLNNDIALLRVNRPIDFAYNIQSIPLATNVLPSGTLCVVSGWGTARYPRKTARFLQYLYQSLVDINECYRIFFGKPQHVRATNVCAVRARGKGTCYGDSGGPLVCDGLQYGIVSTGEPCGKGFPDIYTGVYGFRTWIAQKSGVIV